ncbi:hypothetical protein FRC06_010753 [Ceratobasidium sp. 370]|nr:hypothetical protein FRC06_010753 [Ceratobasidium sp. 370]
MISGLRYLHSQTPPVVHGNINAGKIFIDAAGTAKIGEFGLAMSTMAFPDLVPSISHAGLVRWMSPELFSPDGQAVKPTVKSDIWALGCTFLEVMTRKLPYFQYKHDAKVTQKILEGELPDPQYRDKWQTDNPMDSAIWNMMGQCWNNFSALRPDCKALLDQCVFAPFSQGSFRVVDHDDLQSNVTTLTTLSESLPALGPNYTDHSERTTYPPVPQLEVPGYHFDEPFELSPDDDEYETDFGVSRYGPPTPISTGGVEESGERSEAQFDAPPTKEAEPDT